METLPMTFFSTLLKEDPKLIPIWEKPNFHLWSFYWEKQKEYVHSLKDLPKEVEENNELCAMIMNFLMEGGLTEEQIKDFENEYNYIYLNVIKEKYPDKLIHKTCLDILRSSYKFYQTKRGNVYLENDQLRENGVSYLERKGMVNKLRALDKLEAETIRLGKSLGVRQLKEFMQPDMLKHLEDWGLEKFIRFYKEFIVYEIHTDKPQRPGTA